jgi:hypothetical protein
MSVISAFGSEVHVEGVLRMVIIGLVAEECKGVVVSNPDIP